MAPRRFHLLAMAAWLGISSPSLPALAQRVPTWLEIHRGTGSSSCPNVESVFGSIARLFPGAPIRRSLDSAQASASAVVHVRPTSQGGHEALIRVTRPRDGERVILDQDPGCEGLADALAVALVMLIEPERVAPPQRTESAIAPASTAPPQPEPFAASPKTQRKAEPPRAPTTPPIRSDSAAKVTSTSDTRTQTLSATMRPSVRASVGAFAIGGLGLQNEPSAGAGVSLAMTWTSGFGFVLEGARLWSLHEERPPGRIVADLYGALAGGCYRQTLSSWMTLGSCLVLGGGAQRAAAEGYAINGSRTRPWLVLGPRLELGLRWTEWLEGVTSLSGIGHLRRYSFSVQQVDVEADAPVVGVMLGLGLRAAILR